MGSLGRKVGVRETAAGICSSDKCEPGPISDTDSCMYEIWYLVVFILAYNLVVGAALEMYLPFQKKLVKRVLGCFKGCSKKRQVSPDGELGFEMDLAEVHRKVRKGGVESLSKHEAAEYQKYMADMELVEQFERPELKSVFQGLGSTFYEYNELCVQFGYIIMFSVVFPLGALFALANNFLEIRLDAHKALDSTRRVRGTSRLRTTSTCERWFTRSFIHRPRARRTLSCARWPTCVSTKNTSFSWKSLCVSSDTYVALCTSGAEPGGKNGPLPPYRWPFALAPVATSSTQ